MRIHVPAMIDQFQPGWGGSLSGLGDDTSISVPFIADPTDPTQSIDWSTIDTLPPPMPPSSFPTIDPSTVSIPGYSYNPSSGTYTPASGGGSMSLAQMLGAAATAAQTAAAINRSLQTPALIPGTSLVYNPANGQITSGIATNTTAAGQVLSSISPVVIVAFGVIVVFILASKR